MKHFTFRGRTEEGPECTATGNATPFRPGAGHQKVCVKCTAAQMRELLFGKKEWLTVRRDTVLRIAAYR